MKVQVNGLTYVISWKHDHRQTPYCTGGDETPDTLRFGETVCTVKKDGIVMNTAKAVCSAKEVNYSKETGRKISMARAIKSYVKELRTIFWKAYLGRKLFENPENKENTNA